MRSIIFFLLLSLNSFSQASRVYITGAMKNIMWKGQLEGMINLDTIADKEHLYGLGPLEGLRGEILIIDGTAYISTVISAVVRCRCINVSWCVNTD